MLQLGSTAPWFELTDHRGQTVTLADLLARGPLVLYFYPADFTPLCTRQACMFRDRSGELTQAGVQVVGISANDADKHERFVEKHHLPFDLLADPGRRVAKAYQATMAMGLLPRRVSYFIGEDGRILEAGEANFSLGEHERFIEQVLAHQTRNASPSPPEDR